MRSNFTVENVLRCLFPNAEIAHCECFDWLLNPQTGVNMGLHYYIDKHKLAVVEVPVHHVEYDAIWYPSLEAFSAK